MIKGESILAIIPARGGSKRLPNKNILNLAGKPMIVWSIEAGLKSDYIDEVVVSSDSDEILKISKEHGAITIKRPDELSNDIATSFQAVEHAIGNLNKTFDYVILLQATSPLRNWKHIDEAIELLNKKSADAIISVREMDHSPLWSNILPKDGSMVGFLKKEVINIRSQNLKKYYGLNGAIYICNIKKMLVAKSFFLENNIFAYKMGEVDSIDIDTFDDWEFAEYRINKKSEYNL
jgi:CMP-N-acetylneuraminic acid synthetase